MNAAEVANVFTRFDEPLHRWLGRSNLVPRSQIDDIVQETYVRMLRLARGEQIEDLGAFTFRVARNVAIEWRQRSVNRVPHDPRLLDDLLDDDEIEPAVIAEDEQRAIQKVVSLLTPRQRRILALHTNEGLTYQETAERVGVTYRIVLRDLTRAYSLLRLSLRP